MNIAITIWGNRISPVFDASQMLLIVEIVDGGIDSKRVVTFQPTQFGRFIELLRQHEVQVLVCGAICAVAIVRLESIGIRVAPFLTGEFDRVLEQYVAGKEFTEFAMPGCRIGGCCIKHADFEPERRRGDREGR